uniref:NADH dehydrogenase [ubiquinone] 1 beta subcomplex subunit 1 n=1 Tax=Heterocephalus glaber TaxID=10181 RepID=A0A0N8ET93_HETGA
MFPPPRLPLCGLRIWQIPRSLLPLVGVAEIEAALGGGVIVGTQSEAIMVNLVQIVRDHWVHILVPMGFVLGWYMDRRNDEKLTAFRNKSMLFKRELRPNEEVTWK